MMSVFLKKLSSFQWIMMSVFLKTMDYEVDLAYLQVHKILLSDNNFASITWCDKMTEMKNINYRL